MCRSVWSDENSYEFLRTRVIVDAEKRALHTLNILVSRIDSLFSSLHHGTTYIDDEDINSCVNFPCFSNNASKWHAFLFHHGIVLLPMTIWRRLAHNIRHLVPIYKWSGEGRRKERHYGICALLFWHQSLLILIHKWQHVSLCPFCSDGLDSNDVSLVVKIDSTYNNFERCIQLVHWWFEVYF